MDEWVTLEELYLAYLDCRRRKRGTKACAIFEINEAANLYQLWQDLNDGTYQIGKSIAFCVTRPKSERSSRLIFATVSCTTF